MTKGGLACAWISGGGSCCGLEGGWGGGGGVGWRGEGENTHVLGGAACSLSLYIYAFMCMHMFVIQCCLLFFSFQLNAVYYGY